MAFFRATSQQRRIGRRRGLLVGAAIGSSRSNRQTQQPVETISTPQKEVLDVDALEKLGSLRDAGILTEAEFESKKQQILGIK